jgi:hypothetical protein
MRFQVWQKVFSFADTYTITQMQNNCLLIVMDEVSHSD